MAHFTVQKGSDIGATFQLAKRTTKIGRNPKNDIVLSDDTISRFHCEIFTREGKYFIRDLQSSHGTFVNDVRNNFEMQLEHNNLIRLGQTILLFSLKDADEKDSQEEPVKPDYDLDKEAPHAALLQEGKTIAYTVSSKDTTNIGLTDKHWQILSRTADATLSVFELDMLLSRLMDILFEVFQPDRGSILLYEKDRNELVPRVIRPKDEDFKISNTILNHAVEKRISLLLGDASEDLRFASARSIVSQAIRSAICSPLVRHDRVLGVIYLDALSHKITYQKENLALLNIVAAHVAISIENAILIDEKVRAERLAAMGVAIAGISHYVKNIITGLVGSERLIDMGFQNKDMDLLKNAWGIQKRSTAKISNLVQDMLSYSKEREPLWELGNLNIILRDIYENQKERAQEAAVDLRLELDQNLPESHFDQKGIHDALLNIVNNAIEACSSVENAMVVLKSFQPDEKKVAVWVIDNGPGIPDDIKKKIFEPFFSTKGSKGTGLGLAVTRKTVEEHAGSLELDSGKGRGTIFKISLRINRPDQTQVPAR
ncbi:FHA domain-containing protein [Candidatus Sumerlaeota bacterium]|nr:FHA domain-containing protein [Candidatus Sumerlaeota bacterium]